MCSLCELELSEFTFPNKKKIEKKEEEKPKWGGVPLKFLLSFTFGLVWPKLRLQTYPYKLGKEPLLAPNQPGMTGKAVR